MTANHTRRRLLGGLSAAGAAALAGCTGSTPFVGRRLEDDRTIDPGDAEAIAITGSVGDLTVTGADRETIRLDLEKQASSVRTDLEALRLEADRVADRLEMASPTAERLDLGADRLRGGLRRFVSVPVRRETYRRLAYLLLAVPLGIAYFVFLVVGLSVGVGLSILVVGLPILVLVLGATLLAAQLERWLVTRLLPVEIEGRRELEGDRRRDRALDLLTDLRTWTPFVYLPSVFLLGLGSFVALTTGLSTALAMLLVPLYYDQPGLYVGVVTDRAPEFHQAVYLAWNQLLVGFEAVVTVGYWEITTLPQALVVAAGGLLLEGGYDVTTLLDSA